MDDPHLSIAEEAWDDINQSLSTYPMTVQWLISPIWAQDLGLVLSESDRQRIIVWLLADFQQWHHLFTGSLSDLFLGIVRLFLSGSFPRVNISAFITLIYNDLNFGNQELLGYLNSILENSPELAQLLLASLDNPTVDTTVSINFFYYISLLPSLETLLATLQQDQLTSLRAAFKKWLLQNSQDINLYTTNTAINWLNTLTTEQLLELSQLSESDIFVMLNTQQLPILSHPVNGITWNTQEGIISLETPAPAPGLIIIDDGPPDFESQPSLDSGLGQDEIVLLEDALIDSDPTPTGSFIEPLLEGGDSQPEAASLLMDTGVFGSFEPIF